MTEINDTTSAVALSPVTERFILHWGEMGARWGINRTVAQIHALLYVSTRALNAEQIAATLSVARSNVSNSLRELQGWGIIRVVHVLGDRRDHFESLTDVWQLFTIIMNERKRREVDPTIVLLRECVEELRQQKSPDTHTLGRLTELLGFIDLMAGWYSQVLSLPRTTLVRFFKLGRRISQWVGKASA